MSKYICFVWCILRYFCEYYVSAINFSSFLLTWSAVNGNILCFFAISAKAREGRFRSWTRKYYSILNERFLECKICQCYLKRSSGNTKGNINRHIKLKHPYVYFNEAHSKTICRDDKGGRKPIAQVFLSTNELAKNQLEENDSASLEHEPHVSNIDRSEDEAPDDENTPVVKLSEAELKIVEELNKKAMRRAHYSWTRKYYVRMNDKFIKCKICRRSYKTNAASTGNVRRHIRVKHNDIYLKETQLPEVARNDKSDANESTEDEKESDVVDEPIKITRRDGKIKSWTRKYYQKINDRLIMCLICQKFLRMNIHRHIKQRHPAIYLKENPTTVESTAVSKQDEDMIRNLCEKTSAGTRMSKSCIWNFFETVEHDRLYKCCFCTKTIVILPKKMHNLKRHISTCHEKEYQLILKYSNGDRDVEPSISDDRETASINQVPAVTSVEIAFLSIDGTGGRYKCSCCEEIIESTAEEAEAVLIQHVQICQLKPQDDTDAAVLESVDAPDLLD
ncbi:uncharacterized protein LOC112050199 isoform X3 [Bicyclus anynana]|uniref:Uncharacterized protein LOC112050199 isoform X3 n=1 Tax=Bicyclus anynana TaxID=110368 RepID=A0ABM3LLJ6_BICAN|nr:uncharacterized protein LOC112050199 isoform X3 [Bicyclus anynana]